MKVRGIRIELEALEQAIVELPTVKHCEAVNPWLHCDAPAKMVKVMIVLLTVNQIWLIGGLLTLD